MASAVIVSEYQNYGTTTKIYPLQVSPVPMTMDLIAADKPNNKGPNKQSESDGLA